MRASPDNRIVESLTFVLMAGVSESLAGRAAVFKLPSLSMAEISQSPLAAQTDAFLWRSGFPELWQRPDLDRDVWLGSYVTTYLERDVRQVLNVGDLRDFSRFLRAVAIRSGQLLSYADLARDVGIAPNTAKRHRRARRSPWRSQGSACGDCGNRIVIS